MKTKLKPGDLVYRVVEYDYPPEDNRLHAWMVQERKIISASDRRIVIDTNFSDIGRTRFEPHSLGISFFTTKAEAIDWFVGELKRRVANANRTIITASRGLAWAREQGAHDVE